ncbi:MAG TPA: MBL fold metallo-hydrolase, partial [Polyangiales bacterium]|nr:MBL fold metallo-hydrolase [Polyangiales bacterium]
FNQFLVVDDAPLLYHTGSRRLFPLVLEAVRHVLSDVARLRYVSFSHFEADECGALNDWLRAAPDARAVCGSMAAMLSIEDTAERPPLVLSEDSELALGHKRVRWIDTPHLPHNWECGHLVELSTRTLFCGDVLTRFGADGPALTEADPIGPAEALRRAMPGSFVLGAHTRPALEKLAATEPTTLALMHGSSYRGDGARVLRDLADVLGV